LLFGAKYFVIIRIIYIFTVLINLIINNNEKEKSTEAAIIQQRKFSEYISFGKRIK
jgi:hypothetical protein